MCGGLHRSLKVGDFILPTAAIRDEGASHHFMPPTGAGAADVQDSKIRQPDYRRKGHGLPHRRCTHYRLSLLGIQRSFQGAALRRTGAWQSKWNPRRSLLAGSRARFRSAPCSWSRDLPLKRGGIKTKKSAKSGFQTVHGSASRYRHQGDERDRRPRRTYPALQMVIELMLKKFLDLVLKRSRHRPWHSEHARVRERPRHHHQRAFGRRRSSKCPRPDKRSRRRQRSQRNARPHARLDSVPFAR